MIFLKPAKSGQARSAVERITLSLIRPTRWVREPAKAWHMDAWSVHKGYEEY